MDPSENLNKRSFYNFSEKFDENLGNPNTDLIDEGSSGENFNGNFGDPNMDPNENLDVGNSNEDKVNEVSSGAVTSSQNIQRKRKRMTVMVPTITR